MAQLQINKDTHLRVLIRYSHGYEYVISVDDP